MTVSRPRRASPGQGHDKRSDIAVLRAFAREVLGKEAADYEDILGQVSAAEFLQVFGEDAPDFGQTCIAVVTASEDEECKSEPLREMKKPQTTAAAAMARAGLGRLAFSKGEKREQPTKAASEVRLDLADDDSDFEGAGGDTRALLEAEVSQLCENVSNAAAATAMIDGTGDDRALAGSSCRPDVSEDGGSDPEASKEARDLAYLEQLQVKHELFTKAALHGMTKLERAELFMQHGFPAPKEGDYEIVKTMLQRSRASEVDTLRASMRSTNKRVQMRYVNNELVETKDKYILPKKDSEFIRGTTVQLRLIGNSSKARQAQRKDDDIKGRAGPVSNYKAPAKRR